MGGPIARPGQAKSLRTTVPVRNLRYRLFAPLCSACCACALLPLPCFPPLALGRCFAVLLRCLPSGPTPKGGTAGTIPARCAAALALRCLCAIACALLMLCPAVGTCARLCLLRALLRPLSCRAAFPSQGLFAIGLRGHLGNVECGGRVCVVGWVHLCFRIVTTLHQVAPVPRSRRPQSLYLPNHIPHLRCLLSQKRNFKNFSGKAPLYYKLTLILLNYIYSYYVFTFFL